MDLVTKYIMTHSDGRRHPICGSAIVFVPSEEEDSDRITCGNALISDK